MRYANQSVAYEDPETKQQREGDVVAAYRWITDELAVSVEAAVECKAGKSHPWVAIYADHRQVFETPTLWFMPGGTWPDGEQERLMNEWHVRRLAIPRAACGKAPGVRPLGGRARGDGRRA